MWMQASLSFAIWVAYGIWLARRTAARRDVYSCLCPVRRKVYGPLLMVVGTGLLFGGFAWAVAAEALGPGGFAPTAWLGLTAVGLVATT